MKHILYMGWARAGPSPGRAGGRGTGCTGRLGAAPARARPGPGPCKGYVSYMDIYIFMYIYILSYIILCYLILFCIFYIILYNPNHFFTFLFTLLGSRACLGGWI